MSEAEATAQVSVSSYRSPVEAALGLESELEAYARDKDRRPLLNALKEQFLLNRLVATSQAENTRDLALQILRNRMEQLSHNTLLKAVKVLSEAGAPDLTAVTGTPVPRGRTPMVSIQQAFGLPGGGSQSALGNRTASNPVKETGMLLEALEHVSAHFRDKAAHQIEDEESQRS
jgi:hypothetical protein